MYWFVVFLFNEDTGMADYFLMPQHVLENTYDKNGVHFENPAISIQIIAKSEDFYSAAQLLREKRNG